MVEHPRQVEVVSDLTRRQAVKVVAKRPPTEQIGGAAPHLARARSAQREVQSAVLDQPVHLVEQRRNLLDLVDDDLPSGLRSFCVDLLAQQLRIDGVAPELVCLQQVDATSLGIALPQERALAGLARSPQEEGLPARIGKGQTPLEHAPKNITTI